MTLPSSGALAASQVNVEINRASTTTMPLDDPTVRNLAGKPTAGSTISYSDLQGKSYGINYVVSANTQQLAIDLSTLPGYTSGSAVSVTIDSGVYVWSDDIGVPALNITGGSGATVITLINNGFIMGKGGDGSQVLANGKDYTGPFPGGPAMSISRPITITNASGYIGGGGGSGGGGAAGAATYFSGGGGAGGGNGGVGFGYVYGYGGAIGQVGSNGSGAGAGGGGGRIMPGTGGAGCTQAGGGFGYGGGSGGGGGNGGGDYSGNGGAGGSASAAGGGGGYGSSPGGYGGAGGGGGWGAAGGSGGTSFQSGAATAGGAGGKAINTNGNTVTFVSGAARVYGIVG